MRNSHRRSGHLHAILSFCLPRGLAKGGLQSWGDIDMFVCGFMAACMCVLGPLMGCGLARKCCTQEPIIRLFLVVETHRVFKIPLSRSQVLELI